MLQGYLIICRNLRGCDFVNVIVFGDIIDKKSCTWTSGNNRYALIIVTSFTAVDH